MSLERRMAFYDWINMAFPTFVPDNPMYTFTVMGTNDRPVELWMFTQLKARPIGQMSLPRKGLPQI